MSATSIEWTDAVWNPVRGCSRVSEGCRNCYAERLAARNLPGMRSPTTGRPFAKMRADDARWTGEIELIPSKLDEPLHWRKPRRVFVNSMSDLFHESLPFHDIARVFDTMEKAPRHTFQCLTKRSNRMLEFCEWADENGLHPLRNVWLGVSVEDQATADERIPLLLQTPAAVRFVSYEPALAGVDFSKWLRRNDGQGDRSGLRGHGPSDLQDRARPTLDLIIVGGESGPGARPFDVAWARSAIRQCRQAGVACFYKQGGASNRCSHSAKGGHMECFPSDLQVREFPRA